MDLTGMIISTMGSELFALVVIPILIFCARIIDVSIGTIKLVFITKGFKNISAIMGFFEVLVWLLAISQIMQNLTNFINYIAYAGGFAAGTYIGLCLEDKLAMGNYIVRVITKKRPGKLMKYLKDHGYGVTVVGGRGIAGRSNIILTVVKRKDIEKITNCIKRFNPHAFFSIEEIKYVRKGKFPRDSGYKDNIRGLLRKKK